MRLEWEGEREDAGRAAAAATERAELEADAVGGSLQVANEFAEIHVRRIDTRNGSRLLIESARTGQWVTLCPLELEALTWQSTATFSAMIGKPFGPLISASEESS